MPEEEFSFKHVLTQETIYGSLLRRQRATLHQQVGEAIERLYSASWKSSTSSSPTTTSAAPSTRRRWSTC